MKKLEKVSWGEVNKAGFVRSGFVKINNLLIRQIICETNLQAGMLYLIILSHRNTLSGECFPAISVLANEMSISERTIKTMLTKLCDSKFIIINSGRQGICSNYYFPKEDFYNNEGRMATRRNFMVTRGAKSQSQPKAELVIEPSKVVSRGGYGIMEGASIVEQKEESDVLQFDIDREAYHLYEEEFGVVDLREFKESKLKESKLKESKLKEEILVQKASECMTVEEIEEVNNIEFIEREETFSVKDIFYNKIIKRMGA